MNNKIDWNKPLRTTEGYKVRRVLCLDAIDPDGPDGCVLVELWSGRVARFSIEGKAAFWGDVNLENYSELFDVPVDTLIWVKEFTNNHWIPRYFAGEQDGHPTGWNDGRTSKTAVNKDDVTKWNLYSLTHP